MMEDVTQYILKRVLPESDEERTGWKIESDGRADLVVQKIQKKRNEYKRLREATEEQIALLKDALVELEQEEALDSDIQFYTDRLFEYFRNVEHRKTKTLEIYRLLQGRELVLKRQQPVYVRNDEQIIQYLENADIPEYIQNDVVKRLDWKALKLQLHRSEGQLMFRGNVLPGVEVEDRSNVFEIKGE